MYLPDFSSINVMEVTTLNYFVEILMMFLLPKTIDSLKTEVTLSALGFYS